jgi:hypothetical protein
MGLSPHLLPKTVKIKICRTISLSPVLCDSETCSLTSRKAHRLRMFEDGVLRRISGPNREEVMQDMRTLYS